MPGRVYEAVMEVACEQYGFVTPDDVRELGLDPVNLVRMAERGTVERRGTGLYRVNLVPHGRLDPYMEATLWPRKVRGVLSHSTALELYELSDVNPARIHVSVPRAYRVRRQVPGAYVLHHEDLDPVEVASFEGIPIVTAERAIRQVHAVGLGDALVQQALDQAQERGYVTDRRADALRRELRLVRGDGVRE